MLPKLSLICRQPGGIDLSSVQLMGKLLGSESLQQSVPVILLDLSFSKVQFTFSKLRKNSEQASNCETVSATLQAPNGSKLGFDLGSSLQRLIKREKRCQSMYKWRPLFVKNTPGQSAAVEKLV